MKQASSNIIPLPSESFKRLEAHVNLDKVIYRPTDVVFIEAYIIDSFDKTPIALNQEDTFFLNLFYTLEIYDPTDS